DRIADEFGDTCLEAQRLVSNCDAGKSREHALRHRVDVASIVPPAAAQVQLGNRLAVERGHDALNVAESRLASDRRPQRRLEPASDIAHRSLLPGAGRPGPWNTHGSANVSIYASP